MPCRIYLRRDQSISQRGVHSCDMVTVFAPSWVREALTILGHQLKGITFEVYESKLIPGPDKPSQVLESFTLTEDFNHQSLITLQRIARNEAHNVSGVINKTLYSDVKDKRILYSLRDLVRQCIIVGVDACSRCGGYCCRQETQKKQRVYVCDLAALQFQQPYNSGRLILIQESEEHEGILDKLIYEKVVGEKKRSFQEILSDWNNSSETDKTEIKKRYLRHDGYGLPGKSSCFIDTQAYAAFVKLDVILSGLAICKMVKTHHPKDKINFKFLKYGTGFFAWKFATVLDKLILSAVLDGLEELLKKTEVSTIILQVELPFYKCDQHCAERVKALRSKYGIEVIFGNNDALKQSTKNGILVATTNCGDNHAVCGNEMGFSSVDAAIAENLESKGNIFSPNINLSMTEEYIDV